MSGKKTLLYFSGVVVFWLSILPGCSRQKTPFQLEKWRARTLDGSQVSFSNISSSLLILNFYSPTCQPCVEELPALEILYERARKKGATMFIVLEGNPASHGLSETANPEESYISIRNRMINDVNRYHITIPVAIIDPEFPVFGEKGLITGTPETLILKTAPLVPKYNFVGPIASAGKIDEMLKDERLIFILSRLDEL
jgi:thiol-disulfide isomerase/thioredoxin